MLGDDHDPRVPIGVVNKLKKKAYENIKFPNRTRKEDHSVISNTF